MDAEIGVRNLADPFRYDVLPSVVEAIGFDINAFRKQNAYKSIESIDDLPDYEQLRWKVGDSMLFRRPCSLPVHSLKLRPSSTMLYDGRFSKKVYLVLELLQPRAIGVDSTTIISGTRAID